jgi:hypothetical protein
MIVETIGITRQHAWDLFDTDKLLYFNVVQYRLSIDTVFHYHSRVLCRRLLHQEYRITIQYG